MAKPSALVMDIIRDLPTRPLDAIAVIADRARLRIINHSSPRPGDGEDFIAIVTFIDRFSLRYGLGIEFPKLGSSASNFSRLEAYVEKIRSLGINAVEHGVSEEIDKIISDHQGTSDTSFGIAHLNEDEKRKVLSHLEKARRIIETSKLSVRKKNALFERLADLIREVNTYGTRTDRFFAFAGDLGFVLGDMAENAKPLFSEVKQILKIVTRSRARQEGISLPPGDEVLRLASPDDSASEGE
jgi:hypothetical protein